MLHHGGPQVNKFERVPSVGHQMSVGGRAGGQGQVDPRSDMVGEVAGPWLGSGLGSVGLHIVVKGIICDGHMGTPITEHD